MANDLPDWTGQQLVQVISANGQFLGDVGSPAPSKDVASDTILAPGSGSITAAGVLASFKAAAGAVIAKVGNFGAYAVGSNVAVNPTFGQATVAGHLLVAWVDASGGLPVTASPGWVLAASTPGPYGFGLAIFVKPNCGAAEAPPQFTCAGGIVPMTAILGEFSNAATVAPTDQTGAVQSTPTATVSVTATAADSAFGDLILFLGRWSISVPGPASFSPVMNNATAILAGATQDGTLSRYHSASYGIVPQAKTALPLGVRNWDYDAVGTSAPATGSQATVTLAASTGKAYRVAMLSVSKVQTATTVGNAGCVLKDGVTAIHNRVIGVPAVAGNQAGDTTSGLGLKGTAGNSLTWGLAAADVGVAQAVTVGAYLQ